MTDSVVDFSRAPAGTGLTPRMRLALDAITEHVELHGTMPSRRGLAKTLGCAPSNANRLIMSLVERGELNSITKGGALAGFGRDGVSVFVPAHVAAQLAGFCMRNGETLTAVVADAIALHIDLMEGPVSD